VIAFDIAVQIDGHTREPAKLYINWKSHMGFNGTLFDLSHRQVGSLAGPMIAWTLHATKAGYPPALEGELLD